MILPAPKQSRLPLELSCIFNLTLSDGHIRDGDHEIQLDCFYIEHLCCKHNSKIHKYNG